MQSTQFNREEEFHDAWAEATRFEDVDVDAAFEGPAALEARYLFAKLGDLRGKKVLEVGCGLGEASVAFAKRGAEVTATDISPKMVAFARELARRHGQQIEGAVGAAEDLDLPTGHFDVVYAANTIHHLADRNAFYAKVSRFLKPGGLFCAWDPVKYNPAINVYRRIATKVRSEDERPLGRGDIAELRRHFDVVEQRHFWLLTQLLFVKYFLWSRISPNEERYWKRIYRETSRSLRWWLPLERLDRALLRLPAVRWLSWNVLIIARPKR
jgi:SAM-dependent methyltransferase